MAAGAEDAPSPADLGGAGVLASDKFLGFSVDSLAEGPGVKKLALLGAILLGAAFLFPVSTNFEDFQFAWSATEGGPAFALLFPALAALFGLVAALAPNVAPWIRGAVLSGFGLLGLLICIPSLGALAGAPEKILAPLTLGLVLGGTALILRVVYPREQKPRYLLAAGAALAAAGLLIPVSAPWDALPLELRFYLHFQEGESGAPLGVLFDVFNRDPIVFFSVLYLLLPLALLPAAAVLSWPRPGGPWDKSGLVLRPLAWLAVLYVPLGLGLFTFNVLGWSMGGLVQTGEHVVRFEEFTRTALVSRARLATLAAGFALWAQLGAVALYQRWMRSKRERS